VVDISGHGIAIPLAEFSSRALTSRYSFDLQEEAVAIDKAVKKALTTMTWTLAGWRVDQLVWLVRLTQYRLKTLCIKRSSNFLDSQQRDG
jgi:hypothetical protein